jgi:iron complex transport system permease protein
MKRSLLVSLVLLLLALLFSVGIGSVMIPPLTLVRMLLAKVPGLPIQSDWPETFNAILFQIRLPHVLLVAMTGAALAGSGAAYQGLFRNPLADPYLIGVASGAGLGAVVAMALHWPSELLGMYTIPAAAFLGALLAVAIVSLLAYTGSAMPTTTLILAGVAVSSFATALTSFLMLRSQGELRRAIVWLLGGATTSGWDPVWVTLPYVVLGLGVLLTCGHALNVLQFGEEQAQQLGLAVQRSRVLVIVGASLATAVAISFAGIIGFIGLIVPHVARMLWGPDYRRLIPLSILGGATTLLVADVIARRILAPQELPLGVVTALAGAPFFLWVLRRAQKSAK